MKAGLAVGGSASMLILAALVGVGYAWYRHGK